jgi:hypothetical protein
MPKVKPTTFRPGDRVYFAGDLTDTGTVIRCYWGRRIDPDLPSVYRETGTHRQMRTGKAIEWVRVRWDHCSHCQAPFGAEHENGCRWNSEDRSLQENECAVGIDPVHSAGGELPIAL